MTNNKKGGSGSDGDQPQQTHSLFGPSYEDLVRELSSLQEQRRQQLVRSRAHQEGVEVPSISSISARMKKRPQRARSSEYPYQSPSSEDDQVTNDGASPHTPHPDNNNEGNTQDNSDVSFNDRTYNPQAKVNPKTLHPIDPIKEDILYQLDSNLKEMEMAKKSLPAMSSALENTQYSLALMQTTTNIPAPNLDTHPHEDVSDTFGEEDSAHRMRRRNKTIK